MRNLFHAYYPLSDEQYQELWSNGIIVLDANVLLNLFCYTEDTYDQFIKTLEACKDQLWLPYTVGEEFHRNLRPRKSAQLDHYNELSTAFDSAYTKVQQVANKTKRHRFINSEELLKDFEKAISEIKTKHTSKEDDHKKYLQENNILSIISELYENKISTPQSSEDLEKYYAEAEKRYEEKIPPGYKDNRKNSARKYGDYIIWKELINKSKTDEKGVIFVTDDQKEDWWDIDKEGQKRGPRRELREEFRNETTQNIHFYTSERFLYYAKEHKKTQISEETITEVSENYKAEIEAYKTKESTFQFIHDISPAAINDYFLKVDNTIKRLWSVNDSKAVRLVKEESRRGQEANDDSLDAITIADDNFIRRKILFEKGVSQRMWTLHDSEFLLSKVSSLEKKIASNVLHTNQIPDQTRDRIDAKTMRVILQRKIEDFSGRHTPWNEDQRRRFEKIDAYRFSDLKTKDNYNLHPFDDPDDEDF